MIKSLIISTYDISGGAARAAYRLHKGLQMIGTESRMLVDSKASDDTTVIAPSKKLARGSSKLRPFLDAIPLSFYPERERVPYAVQWVPGNLHKEIGIWNPDIINLHWICRGYMSIEAISRLGKPVVWSLHDMWPFTGGCHYDQGCGRYMQSCGGCPQLNSQREIDLSRWVWQRKRRTWKNLNLTVVALSQWLAQCARQSALFGDLRIEIIPNGLDIERFKPVDKHIAREMLDLPQDKRLILFGALSATTDSRKGFDLLKLVLHYLGDIVRQDEVEVVIMGASQSDPPVDLKFTPHYLGSLRDDISIRMVYAAADVFVTPSRQDNLSNMVMESLACGTPCVAFGIGGMPDMIDHQYNGYLAQPFETEEMAYGIQWLLENEERHQKLSQNARQTAVRKFDQELQARRYLKLYEEILT
jgi:glycosyltransferase involved in cell wall biosynthesis